MKGGKKMQALILLAVLVALVGLLLLSLVAMQLIKE